MDKPDAPRTLGQAIDAIVEALNSLDEASQVTAIKAACDPLKISPPESVGARQIPPGGTPSLPAAGETSAGPTDIRTLKGQKQPSSANEMSALVAFYLSELAPDQERKKEVQVDDMTKYFKQAGFPLPQRPRVLLANAKHAGYFDTAGDGKYRLNAVGYNLVAHNLPRARSSEAIPPRRNRRRGSPTRGRKKRNA